LAFGPLATFREHLKTNTFSSNAADRWQQLPHQQHFSAMLLDSGARFNEK